MVWNPYSTDRNFGNKLSVNQIDDLTEISDYDI